MIKFGSESEVFLSDSAVQEGEEPHLGVEQVLEVAGTLSMSDAGKIKDLAATCHWSNSGWELPRQDKSVPYCDGTRGRSELVGLEKGKPILSSFAHLLILERPAQSKNDAPCCPYSKPTCRIRF